MKKYNLLLFLFILPTISAYRVARNRRRPSVDHQHHHILDQIAQANTWQSPNRIISASYARNAGTGHVNNANLMINLIPHNEESHSVDLEASQTLSNAQSAAEYVTRALQMRKTLRDKAPHSSYVKYDIYEKEKTQRVYPSHERRLVTQRPSTKSDSVTRNSKIYEDYRRPDELDDFGEGELMYRESNHRFNGHYDSPPGYDHFKSDVKEITEAGIPKAELMKHIEKSVVRYMKRLESEGGLPKAATPRPHTEIKTYYRLPKLNTDERIKNYAEYTSTESELFKPTSTKPYKTYKSPNKGTFTTVTTPYPNDHYTTMNIAPNIDLTIRSRRPKPVDFSALDIGQSWSHGSGSDHYTTTTAKPKLKFNSQTYEDINAMTYSPGKGLIQDEPSYTSSNNYPCIVTEPFGTKLRDGLANVGASITVGPKYTDTSDAGVKEFQDPYRKPLHIINGVPVLNPYKVNMDTLKHMFGSDPEEIVKDGWHPYSPSDNGGTRQQPPLKEATSASNTYNNHQLPFDSYNPKYNNNPEGQGYQDHWQPSDNSHRQRGTIGSDMHSSSSSTTPPKKIRNATTVTIHKKKRKKNKTKIIKINTKKNKNLQTELRPPPAQKS